jgi:hypothetical protein
MELQVQVVQEHTKLNEKQKQIEDSFEITIEAYKSKLFCVQCGKESEKIKCKTCASESFHIRNKYFLFSGIWTVSSIVVFSTLDIVTSIPVGFCCATLASEIYSKIYS